MYQTICTKVTRTYGQAEQYIRNAYRHNYMSEKENRPKIIRVDVTEHTPCYFAVMVRVHVADQRF